MMNWLQLIAALILTFSTNAPSARAEEWMPDRGLTGFVLEKCYAQTRVLLALGDAVQGLDWRLVGGVGEIRLTVGHRDLGLVLPTAAMTVQYQNVGFHTVVTCGPVTDTDGRMINIALTPVAPWEGHLLDVPVGAIRMDNIPVGFIDRCYGELKALLASGESYEGLFAIQTQDSVLVSPSTVLLLGVSTGRGEAFKAFATHSPVLSAALPEGDDSYVCGQVEAARVVNRTRP